MRKKKKIIIHLKLQYMYGTYIYLKYKIIHDVHDY